MRARTALAATLVAATAAGSFLATAHAAPPKNFEKTVTYTDPTPDPSGNAASGNENHCDGQLPREAPIELKVPGPGMVEVALSGFHGDWTLQIQNAAGETIGGADVNPPDQFETASVRLKKAQTIKIAPCNLAGTPQVTVKMSYKYKK